MAVGSVATDTRTCSQAVRVLSPYGNQSQAKGNLTKQFGTVARTPVPKLNLPTIRLYIGNGLTVQA